MSFTPLQWNPGCAIQVEEIDLQHRYFLRLVNRLAEDLPLARDEHYRRSLLNELARYAPFHFLSEENLMVKLGYPGLEQHRQRHFELLDKLSLRMSSGPTEELLEFLTDWLVHHAAREDRLIGEFVRSQKAGGAPKPS
jgi:hemerythrin-like metal-binding protein